MFNRIHTTIILLIISNMHSTLNCIYNARKGLVPLPNPPLKQWRCSEWYFFDYERDSIVEKCYGKGFEFGAALAMWKRDFESTAHATTAINMNWCLLVACFSSPCLRFWFWVSFIDWIDTKDKGSPIFPVPFVCTPGTWVSTLYSLPLCKSLLYHMYTHIDHIW